MPNGTTQTYPCFICSKALVDGKGRAVITKDGQTAEVGSDCFKKVKASGSVGYPQMGNPKYVRCYVT